MAAATHDPIRHVVLLMLENRSFDQMLGSLKAVYPDLVGVDPAAPHENSDADGRIYRQEPTALRQMLQWDPHHEVEHVAVQLANGNGGFVRDFSAAYPDSTAAARQQIMSYYALDSLPALHRLAHAFTICDHWHASLPGPTWPNRFFALTGTANGRVGMPGDGTHRADLPGYFQQTQDTIFDRLNERAIDWKVYFHDIPQTTVLTHQREPHNVARYFYIDQFYDDARGNAEAFPAFVFIEPSYLGFGLNDGHPPHDIMRAEKLIADVYNAIRANEALWQSTLLIIAYDEHGGFYDHVAPPAAVPPDAHTEEYGFDRLGVRVPAILVSPWVEAGVVTTPFDHTSVLRYLIDKWQLGPLGARVAAAASIGVAISRRAPREDTLPRIELTAAELEPPDRAQEEEAFGEVNPHQTALQLLAAHLKAEAVQEIPLLASVAARCLEGLRSLVEAALRRLYGEPPGIRVSIAEPDKLAGTKDVTARDHVARFVMRKKQYAAIGLKTRLDDSALDPPQVGHALRTLEQISGRKFDGGARQDRAGALRWLAGHRR